jgi:hypothetical protein
MKYRTKSNLASPSQPYKPSCRIEVPFKGVSTPRQAVRAALIHLLHLEPENADHLIEAVLVPRLTMAAFSKFDVEAPASTLHQCCHFVAEGMAKLNGYMSVRTETTSGEGKP